MQETIQTIKTTTLFVLPTMVTNPTKKIVDQYADVASIRPKDLPVIDVGRVNGKNYVITHDAVYRACKHVRLDEIQASVTEYQNMSDAIVAHVRKNKDPSAFEPLLVRDAVDFLAERGIDEHKAIRLFLLHNTATEKILRLPLAEKTIKKLKKLNEFLSEKLTSVSMPSYIPAKIAKIDPTKQGAAVEEIESLVMMETISDARFAWPNPDVVDVALSEFTKTIKKEQEPKIATVVDDVEDIAKKDSDVTVIKHSKTTLKNAANVAKSFSNVIYIEGDAKSNRKPMVVDTKTGRVAEIQNKNKVQSLVGDLGSQTFVFPDTAVKHLDLANDNNIHMKKFTNIGELQTILKNANKKKIQVSGVIFTQNKL